MSKKKGNTTQRLRLEYRKPSELADNPANWRKHPEEQLKAIEDVLAEVGWAGVLLYNERTQRLVDGHARKQIASKTDSPVPVLIGSWSDDEEQKILATLDPIAGMATTDAKAFASLTKNMQMASESLTKMIANISASVANQKPKPKPGSGGDEFDPTPPNRATRTSVGELWQCGPHRLKGHYTLCLVKLSTSWASGDKPSSGSKTTARSLLLVSRTTGRTSRCFTAGSRTAPSDTMATESRPRSGRLIGHSHRRNTRR